MRVVEAAIKAKPPYRSAQAQLDCPRFLDSLLASGDCGFALACEARRNQYPRFF
jgi:hypothetical protein